MIFTQEVATGGTRGVPGPVTSITSHNTITPQLYRLLTLRQEQWSVHITYYLHTQLK